MNSQSSISLEYDRMYCSMLIINPLNFSRNKLFCPYFFSLFEGAQIDLKVFQILIELIDYFKNAKPF